MAQLSGRQAFVVKGLLAVVIGASSTPTRYRVVMADIPMFVRCGADILLNGLRARVEGEARCPVCDTVIRLRIHEARVEDLHPPTALLHVVELPSDPGTIAIACEHTHLFDRELCLREWLRNYSGPRGLIQAPQRYLDRCLRRQTGH